MRVSSQGVMGGSQLGGRPGWSSSQVGMELFKSVTLFVSPWGNVEV